MHARFAQIFKELIESSSRFELAAPVSLSLVCFRLKGKSNEEQREFLEAVKDSGECFIIHTKLGDEVVLRFACGGLEQTEDDIRNAFKVIEAAGVL